MSEQKSSSLTPFLMGTTIGAVVAIVVGLTSGIVTTSSLRDVQVAEARLDGEAQVCASRVANDRRERGDTSDLRGYGSSASEARIALAQSFSQPKPGQSMADSVIVRACADRLNGVS